VVIDGVVDDITSTNITLSAWVKTTQTNEGNVFAANTSTGSHPLMFGVTGGNPFVNDGSDITFPPAVNDDQWHLITYVRDGDTGYVYADGTLRLGNTVVDRAGVGHWPKRLL
ncbi:MAG: LamG-like jellyroll fold domain-containing protein, partial [Planctomycetota bacterium]